MSTLNHRNICVRIVQGIWTLLGKKREVCGEKILGDITRAGEIQIQLLVWIFDSIGVVDYVSSNLTRSPFEWLRTLETHDTWLCCFFYTLLAIERSSQATFHQD